MCTTAMATPPAARSSSAGHLDEDGLDHRRLADREDPAQGGHLDGRRPSAIPETSRGTAADPMNFTPSVLAEGKV